MCFLVFNKKLETKDVNVKLVWIEKFDSVNAATLLATSERNDGFFYRFGYTTIMLQ